jgi:hypothetical protein
MKKIALLCATTAIVMPSAAFAQSTGATDFENSNNAIVVTGTRNASVGGVVIPDTSKTREQLNAEFIQRQTPGQSINEVINQLPGVSFTNNDPFGSAGGSLIIRGFDNSRIAETFDGMPLNDTGNYAIFSNQMLDSELINQVNVSLGSTDVDTPIRRGLGQHRRLSEPHPVRAFRPAPAGLLRLVRGRRLHARLRRARHRQFHAVEHARLALGLDGDQRQCLRSPRPDLQAAV